MVMRTSALNSAKLESIRVIVVHDACADGTVSAILLKDAFYGREVQIKFVQYNTPEHKNLVAEPGMLFCDFSPVPERVQEFVDAGAIVLDHHKTSKPIVDAFGENGIFGDEVADPGICGASLAFRHVWLPRRGDLTIQRAFAAEFATLAGIRDTWQRHDERWKDACIQANVLYFIPNERWLARNFTELASSWARDFRPIGELLYERNEKGTLRASKAAYRFTTQKGTRVVIFDGLKESSDVADLLGKEADLVVGFLATCENGTPQYLYSTRSHTTFDCATLAKSLGGGGHTKAAGFNVQIDPESALNPYACLKAIVENFEAKP
jgi:oligoribonuclease NrnB/cAMP/cGMP phosphodiesterase (DHH superfamily)